MFYSMGAYLRFWNIDMFNWLFLKRRKDASVTEELAAMASIADKLSKYNADEDTTISEFSLADDDKKSMTTGNLARMKRNDAWNAADPSETGRWKKENR